MPLYAPQNPHAMLWNRTLASAEKRRQPNNVNYGTAKEEKKKNVKETKQRMEWKGSERKEEGVWRIGKR